MSKEAAQRATSVKVHAPWKSSLFARQSLTAYNIECSENALARARESIRCKLNPGTYFHVARLREIAEHAGERIARSSTRPTPGWWTSRCWERTSSCTHRRDAARGRAYASPRDSPRWRPWGPTRQTPRKVRNTLTTHNTEWAVRVFFIHLLSKQLVYIYIQSSILE